MMRRSPQLSLKTEKDLRTKIVSFLRSKFPWVPIIPGLGEFQDTSDRRLEAWAKGYFGGSQICSSSRPAKEVGLALELKSP